MCQVKPYNIYVTLNFPPDTDTPMLQAEMEIKVSTNLKTFKSTKVIFCVKFLWGDN